MGRHFRTRYGRLYSLSPNPLSGGVDVRVIALPHYLLQQPLGAPAA
jgi:hypothetical protein